MGVLGNVSGTRLAQICLSHGFGDGKEQSCELTVEAVQRLLYGIPIDFYVSVPFDAVGRLNDAVGGVTVTVEDDFTEFDKAMSPGTTLTLNGDQTELFVRYRMTISDGSNAARMVRQRAYMSAFMTQFDEVFSDNPNIVGSLFDTLGDALVTNMKRGRMINEANRAADYQRESLWSPVGDHTTGDTEFVEFHADEDALCSRHWYKCSMRSKSKLTRPAEVASTISMMIARKALRHFDT